MNRIAFSLATGIIAVCSSLLVAADPVPVTQQSGTDFVFYAPDYPRVFRFIVTVDGLPLEAYEERVLTELFALLDQDGDGVLSSQERVLLPAPGTLTKLGISTSGKTASRQLLQQSPRSSVKTKNDLRTYFRQLGFDVLSLNIPAQAAPVSASPGELLFHALDADHDRRISPAELKLATQTLRKFDLNGDDIWTSRELVTLQSAPTDKSQRTNGPTSLVPVATLRPAQFGMECVQRYRGLSITSPSSLPQTIVKLDADGDGRLSAGEWAGFLSSLTPDRIVFVEGKTDSGSSRAFSPALFDSQGQATNETGPNEAALQFGNAKLRIQSSESAMSPDESALKKSFEALDRDKNDYIDRNESNSLTGVDFFEVDMDKNGQVFWEEYQAGMKPLFLMMALKTRIDIDESGFDLFKEVNTDDQPGLTLRELINLPQRMNRWDFDRDGVISSDELPQEYKLTVSRGLSIDQLSRRGQQTVDTTYTNNRVPRQQFSSGKPAWFSKMDRNRDEDLSPREFLGDAQMFDLLDKNHDGLIDRTEAMSAPK